MKKIGMYTKRGRIPHLTEVKLNLFDGSYKTGFKLVSFKIAPYNFSAADDSTALGRLATEEGLALVRETFWDFGDQRQIAWAATNGEGFEAYPQGQESIIDPENLIIEDLYITALNGGDSDTNYIATFEKYALEPFQGTLAIVGNMSQG